MLSIPIILFFFVLWLLWISYKNSTTYLGAPFVPLEPENVAKVIELSGATTGKIFYDLGSGDGRMVIAAALHGATATGVEIDKLKVLYSRIWIRLLRLQDKACIIRKNIFAVDLSDADIVVLYLLQETNDKLQEKLEKELKKGTRVVSVAFNFPGWIPVHIDPKGPIYGPIFVYQR
ncbi:hypothetical protein A2Y99_00675 [Candidatus Gottesmanbacteria bacterium RBG_13_37_7]|uniref:DOT1 domain-containing protein n=1 Tax=Candidatus Gottesmanbacteria bacterium RBG_13_37_7 TaxID=1798369 RepID=A0A1F5YG33_9BACT|nr:MAG: hypothetical protein A2Y99_00675 [Candidatus Gottesmanbacteria bacterium RBG_13_37_7]